MFVAAPKSDARVLADPFLALWVRQPRLFPTVGVGGFEPPISCSQSRRLSH